MISRDLLGSLLFLMLFTAYSAMAWHIPLLPFEEYEVVTSATMPKIYGIAGMVICLISLVVCLLKQTGADAANRDTSPTVKADSKQENTGNIRRTALLFALMLLYALLLEPAGFILATLGFLAGGFYIMGERRSKVLLLATIPVVLLFWLLMTQVLDIYLATGTMWE
ncbi:hypothetical protein NFHSH190041_15270 [Shewanella sp. NFH-SH190041]|uniref:tripartite tricarboxylate transporter TctB family protein n=1 Tax=Shewanella sp. NFH-SH190041 TaxID=2950245 RepID=UPI0021C2A9C3|nr:tripartite tricarboxylate transporter TctB family protein [Shewanella sp. NFH-SH190041]BDM64075.1 hypothetical protein NFHSH190041_15270 [Shewanella sp. NFH-SH190041]